MSRERRVQPVPTLALTALWVLFWGDLSAANVVIGLVLAALVLLVFPLPRLIIGVRFRPWQFLVLSFRFLADVVLSSIQVTKQALGSNPHRRNSVLVIQLQGREELFQTIVAEMTCLVPGSLVIDLHSSSGRMALHVMAADTPAAVEDMRREVLALERRVLAALAAHPDDVRRRALAAEAGWGSSASSPDGDGGPSQGGDDR